MIDNRKEVGVKFDSLLKTIQSIAKMGHKMGLLHHAVMVERDEEFYSTPEFMLHDVCEISTRIVCVAGGWSVTYVSGKGYDVKGILTEDFLEVEYH